MWGSPLVVTSFVAGFAEPFVGNQRRDMLDRRPSEGVERISGRKGGSPTVSRLVSASPRSSSTVSANPRWCWGSRAAA
jgi:hypothetical protein